MASKIRLYLSALLLISWLGYLAFLAIYYRHPVIVSRSQFAVAQHVVVADLALDANGEFLNEAKVTEDLSATKLQVAGDLKISNLNGARRPDKLALTAGFHLLLLEKQDDGTFKLCPTPSGASDGGRRLYVYPWTTEVKNQIEKLRHGS
jgi:hypothetical protein